MEPSKSSVNCFPHRTNGDSFEVRSIPSSFVGAPLDRCVLDLGILTSPTQIVVRSRHPQKLTPLAK